LFQVTFSYREMWGIAFFVVLTAIPLVASSILSWRSYRRGWWLAIPALLFLTITPAIIFVFAQTGQFEETGVLAMSMLALVLGAWASLSVFLVALAIAGPKLPRLDVEAVF
jgi:hypothetical protein